MGNSVGRFEDYGETRKLVGQGEAGLQPTFLHLPPQFDFLFCLEQLIFEPLYVMSKGIVPSRGEVLQEVNGFGQQLCFLSGRFAKARHLVILDPFVDFGTKFAEDERNQTFHWIFRP